MDVTQKLSKWWNNFIAGGVMVNDSRSADEDNIELLYDKIENLRLKLLDLSRRNPLISAKLGPRSSSSIRVVDEFPDVLAYNLINNSKMRFVPLPSLEEDPKDEQSREFQSALSGARLTDGIYLEAQDKIDPDQDDALEEISRVERELKDRVRIVLEMSPHSTSEKITIAQHAKNNHISPAYDLPQPEEEHEDGRHMDTDIQTLLLPDDLERKMNSIVSKCRTWDQETGINVMHAAFGFLEWKEPTGQASNFAPLVLSSVEVEKNKTRAGLEFWVQGRGEKHETNLVLAEKLKRDFGMELPVFSGGSIEDYMKLVAENRPPKLNFRIRRQVVFGVFPSARMAMYHDLDTDTKSFDQSDVLKRMFVGSETSEASPSPFAEEYEVDDPEIEKKVPNLVLEADSSQYSTLVDVADGINVAVEGPPGTGKSQTIVNAIATALASGKKVLFVAQKMAALDIVRSRLEAVGLGEFVLPLQADRSSREKVIKSVRDRVEMGEVFDSREHQIKTESFREYRSELAAYVEVISQQFGEAGRTVHDILWMSISTQHVLEKLPIELRSMEIENVELFSGPDLSKMAELSERIEKAWINSEAARPFWKGCTVYNIHKFSVDNICDSTSSAANAYETISDLRQNLSEFRISPDEDIVQLEALIDALQQLRPIGFTFDLNLVDTLLNANIRQSINDFLSKCNSFREKSNELSQQIEEPINPEWESRFSEIKEICSDNDFETLDIKKLQEFEKIRNEKFIKFKNLASLLRPFLEIFPDCVYHSIDQLRKAGVLVDNASKTSLAIRDDFLAEPSSAILIRQTKTRGEDLRVRKAKLGGVISTKSRVMIDDLRRYAAEINQSSMFSLLSVRYWVAKKAYSAVSSRSSFEKSTAVLDLNNLADWKDDHQKFISQPGLDKIFGNHFRGIDTDFNLFSGVLDFYDAVEHEFPGIENLAFRRLLKTGDLELLNSIPNIEDEVWDGTFPELELEIDRLAEINEGIAVALDRLSLLVQEIKYPQSFPPNDLNNLSIETKTLRESHDELENSGDIEALIGERFAGSRTEAAAIEKELRAAEVIAQIDPRLKRTLLNLLTSSDNIEGCEGAINEIIDATKIGRAALDTVCESAGLSLNHFVTGRTTHEIYKVLLSAAADEGGLYAHSELAAVRSDFVDFELPDLATKLEEHGMPLSEVGAINKALIARSLAKRVYQKFGTVLARFGGEKLDDLRAKLAKTDREIIELSREHLRFTICRAASPPQGRGLGKKSTWTELELIENEINKKKRFIPVRDLIQRAGKALLELKSCWMMSPLAVAQYCPRGSLKFDLCIIDEASQMPPEDAVGALVRCDQAMVVGDTNQLPPTSFFRRMFDDEDADEDETVLEESVLGMANTAFRPKRRLRWHYRSRHSGLIKFSNRLVYDDDLIVFPSANEDRKDMGVSLIAVKGSYKSGLNSPEATVMINAALDFMHCHPDRSLGMVTLNQKQRDLLSDEMDYALRYDNRATGYIDSWKERNSGLETFFIKNLENVQGDERDVIFIGTVYGAEKHGGPVMQRFGPINGLAGQRRLNVLFSRAKEKIVTFSSMTGTDIKADEFGNPGTHMLKRWLEYSATGVLDAGVTTQKEPDSDFEVFVIEQIHAMGCIPVPQVGVSGYFIDIGVKHQSWPHGFVLGVECDGATYHSSKSARDRDRLRQEVLEGLGWHFHRIWSTDWFNNPLKEAEKLREVITARLERLQQELKDLVVQPTTSAHHQPFEEIDQEIIDDTLDGGTEDDDLAILATNPEGAAIGDTVRVRYLTGSGSLLELTLSDQKNDPENGIISIHEPLGRALLDTEEGEEIEVLVGSYVRRAVIENLKKEQAAPQKTPPFSPGKERNDRQSQVMRDEPGLFKRSTSKPDSRPSPQQFEKRLSPDRFYDPEYQFVVRDLSTKLIDDFGPITFRHLSEKIARLHDFNRTGSKIRKIVWFAVHKDRKSVKGPKGENIFWPKDMPPETRIPFRGMDVNGEKRSWQQVPYSEKLGLAYSVVTSRASRDPVETMARKIGLGRLGQKTKDELIELLNYIRASDLKKES